jgi:predicted nucleotidyltransferase
VPEFVGELLKRGSLWFDIDLAVWGLPENRFYAAVGAITCLTSNFKIDLVDATDCRESLKKSIELEGVEMNSRRYSFNSLPNFPHS